MTDFGEKEYPYLSLLSCTDTRKSGGVFYKYRPDVIIVSPRNIESGVGVLASNVLKQCTDFGLEVSLIEFEYSSYSLDFRAEFYDHAQSAKLVIYCISLIEFNYLYYLVGPGPMKGISFKSVYYGPWELESVPHELTEALGGVGEIWGISQFASRAFAERHPNVGKIGIAVNQEGESLDKASQKSGYFQFLTVCANGSYLERKNPLGVLEAFLAAFPRNCATNYCRLRIHISDLSKFELPAELDTADDRVLITFGTLSRSDYIEMFETSHCYVSLHRAEGFGYAVAEAVDFGLEVITTNSGGILDFCSRDNCYLVGFRKKEIDPKDYPYSRGLYWAEPDLFDAAHAMAQCVSSPKKNLGPNSLEMYSKNVQENLYKRLVSRDLT
jgi:glycosyltransferase involved in cell wall biosynthesis